MLFGLLRKSVYEDPADAGGGSVNSWPTLLVVDNDREMVQTLVCFFEKRGFQVAAAANVAEAKEVFRRRKTWTLVMADYHLPDDTGWDLYCWVREQPGDTPFLLMSGSPQCSVLCAGTDFLPKPFTLEKIDAYVRTLGQRA